MNINKYIDHTLLKPIARNEDIIKLCNEAKQYEFASVCINPCYVKLAKQHLTNSDVKITTVIGFPLGANTTNTKVYEITDAINNGADEIDMVINIGMLKNKDYDYVLQELKACKEAIPNNILKVILETCLLSNEEIVKACELAVQAGVDYVKTSTGFSESGANVEVVALMSKTVGNKAKVKAAGGVRNLDDVQAMIGAGASRIGTSSGVEIINNQKTDKSY